MGQEHAAAEQHEQRYRMLAEHQSALICHAKPDTTLTFVNDAYCELLRRVPEELIGKSFLLLIPEEEQEEVRQLFQTLTTTARIVSNYRSTHETSGDRGWQEWISVPTLDEAGSVVAYQLIGRNIHDSALHEGTSWGSDARLQAFDNNPAVSFVKDLAGRYVRVNRAFVEAFQLPLEKVIGMTDAEIFPPEQASLFRGNDLKTLQADCSLEFEEVALYGDELHITIVSKFPVKNSSGKTVGICGIATDITARKHMEEALRESEARRRSLIEAIPQQVWTARPDGTLDYVNQRVMDYFNCGPDDLLGWEWQSVLHSDDLPACLETWTRALSTGEPYVIEFRLRRACDGAYRWHLARAMPVKDACGRIVKWFGTNTDITELKEAKEALQIGEERFRGAFDSASIGMALVGIDGRWLQVNQALCELVGYTEQELLASNFQAITHPEDLEADLKSVRRMLAGEIRKFQMEKRYLHKQGHPIWILLSVSLVHDLTRRPLYFVAQIEDITERKEASRKLSESAEQLKALTVHLQHVREEERARIARELHDELGQLLTSLTMNISSIAAKLFGSPGARDAGLAERMKRLAGLVEDALVSLQRIVNELRPAVLDRLGLVSALEWLAEEVELKYGIDCAVESATANVEVGQNESTALFRVAQEALTNVVRHAQATKVTIAVQSEDRAIRLIIKDNGKGISERDLRNPSRFGLQSMRERIGAFAGVVQIEGQSGQGTTITVDLPWRDAR